MLRYFGLFALLAVAGLVATQSASAAVPYPSPHRSWVKVGAVAYQSTLTSAQLSWSASHFDWLDNPHSEFLAQYKSNTDATMLIYDEFYSTYLSDWKWCCMQDWAKKQGIDPESMLLHYSEPTTVSNSGHTYNLKAGDHVLCFWGDTGTDRVVCNPKSAAYQAFSTYWAGILTGSQYGGATYDGVFVDDAFPNVLVQQCGDVTSGGAVAEYPNGDAWTQFDADMVKVYAATRTAFGTKGAAGSKQLWLNSANYVPDNLDAAYPYIDGLFREFCIYPSSMYAGRLQRLTTANANAKAHGVASVVGAYGIESTDTYALAMFYVASDPQYDFFCRQDTNSGDLQTYAWVDALDIDIGTPLGPATVSGDVFTRKFTKATVVANLSSGTGSITPGNNGSTAPTAAFTVNPSSGTAPLTVQFSDTSLGAPTSWAWTFGDGGASTAQSPGHQYTAAGSFSVSLTAKNAAGSNTATKSACVTVSAAPSVPVASFTAAPSSGTVPLTAQFTDTSAGSPTSWSWSFGDGSTSTVRNPSHQYTAAGTYSVSLTAKNGGGSNTATKSGCVKTTAPAAPVASFTVAPSSGTAPLTVQFMDSSTNTPTAWSWTFGDNATSTAKSPSHQYVVAGSYGVSLTAKNAGGSNTVTKSGCVTVRAPAPVIPAASFTVSPSSGTAPLTVQFTDTSTNTPTAWAWTFGDSGTSTAKSPSHQYGAAGTFAVSLTASNAAGSNTATKSNCVTVSAVQTPLASFVASPSLGTAPLTVQFTDTSSNTPTSWSWAFGDGGTSTAKSPSHQYGAPGSYTVSLTASNAAGANTASKDKCVTVTEVQLPTASFTLTPTSGAAPLAVQFTDTSTKAPTAWAWDFGDGTAATAASPSHQYGLAGTYDVSLTASNAAGANTVTRTGCVTAWAPASSSPAPRITAVTLSKSSVTLGGTFDVTVTVTNDGAPAGASGVTLSLPALTGSGDASYTSAVSASWGSYREYPRGSGIYTVADSRISAKYLLVECDAASWPAATSRTFTVRVKPRAKGKFVINARAWMADSAGVLVTTDPSAAAVLDQQGWPVAQYSVTVN